MSSITRIPAHVQLAASEGMKAGFRQFATVSARSGLGPVQELWSEFEALSAKPRFNLYCSMFGPSVDALQAEAKPARKRTFTRSSGRVKNAVAAPIQEARKLTDVQRIAELQAEIDKLTKAPKVEAAKVIAPSDPKAPVTYKQAMTLRFKMGLSKKAVAKLNQGQASTKIAAFYAAA